jgi:hypothetical protein
MNQSIRTVRVRHGGLFSRPGMQLIRIPDQLDPNIPRALIAINAVALEFAERIEQIQQRAAETIECPGHYHVEATARRILQ